MSAVLSTPFDHVIVGGGSAGAALAARLSAHPGLRVCLLEAGPDTPPGQVPDNVLDTYYSAYYDPSLFWPGLRVQFNATRAAGRPARPYEQARIMGGGSSVNAMIGMRGLPDDYEEWAALGLDGWGWDDVLPHFRRLENDLDHGGPLHGRDGPITIRRTPRAQWPAFCEAVARHLEGEGWAHHPDMNGAPANGLFEVPMTNTPQRRVSSAIGYLTAEVRRRPNLHIVGQAFVERVLFQGRQAEGVSVLIGGQRHTVRAREVTVCAGALQSPALLQRSGVGPAALLQSLGVAVVADRPGVGANLQDHPPISVACHLQPQGRQRPALRTAANLGLRYDSGVPGCAGSDMYVSVTNKASWHAVGHQLGALVICLYKPYSRGSVRIASAAPEAPPDVDFNMLADERDVARLSDAVRRAAAIYASPTLRTVTNEVFPSALSERIRRLNVLTPRNRWLAACGAPLLDGPAVLRRWLLRHVVNPGLTLPDLLASETVLQDWLKDRVTGFYHPVGTCRMGVAGDDQAVVDAQGRVHGVVGLRVADASIMPTIPRANTNLSTLMIAENLAQRMLQRDPAPSAAPLGGQPVNTSRPATPVA